MRVKVLVVDDIPANVKLLEARLQAERFDVLTASSGLEALEICANGGVDVVLMDVRMPGMDGLLACQRLKTNPVTQHISLAIVTALDRPSDKLKGLEAGADDFLVKPVDDIALITCVRNLGCLKVLSAEMAETNERVAASNRSGVLLKADFAGAAQFERGHILIVDPQARRAQRLAHALLQHHTCEIEVDPPHALLRLMCEKFDAAIVNLNLPGADALALCSKVCKARAHGHLPLIVLVEPDDRGRLLCSLEMGVDDYLVCPIERHDLLVRVRTQIKIKRYADFLGRSVEEALLQASFAKK